MRRGNCFCINTCSNTSEKIVSIYNVYCKTFQGFANITWKQHALQSRVSVNKRAPIVMKFKCIATVYYESWRYELLKKNAHFSWGNSVIIKELLTMIFFKVMVVTALMITEIGFCIFFLLILHVF